MIKICAATRVSIQSVTFNLLQTLCFFHHFDSLLFFICYTVNTFTFLLLLMINTLRKKTFNTSFPALLVYNIMTASSYALHIGYWFRFPGGKVLHCQQMAYIRQILLS